MPDVDTERRAARDRREGKAASTQAGEYVREEMHHIREGKHGAASTKQAIAIGLSKARRAGVHLNPPAAGTTSAATRRKAARDEAKGAQGPHAPSARRSRAVTGALKREGHQAASRQALGRQAKRAAHKRSKSARSAQAKRAARTRARNK